MNEQDLDNLSSRIADLIIKSKRTVVFTGAGISTESGIPDFRSPSGIWERFNPDDFTYQKFVGDAKTRLVIINLSVTPMDKQASVLVRARAGEAMSLVAQKVKEKIG